MTQVKAIKKPSYGFIALLDRISFSQVFTAWLIIIILFGTIFFLLLPMPNNGLLSNSAPLTRGSTGFLDSLYFSFVTATSLGFGDIAPLGISKFLASFEAILGLIVYGVLISKLVGVKQEVLLEEVYNISYEEIIDRLRSGLYLFRSDVNRVLEKIESDTIKHREIKDLWILFSGLDTTLNHIKKMIKPHKKKRHYYKNMDVFRLELFLNSIELSMKKVLELLFTLKSHDLQWRDELLVTSVEDDVKTVREIIHYQYKKTHEKKVSDKLKEMNQLLKNIESELKQKDDEEKEMMKNEK